MRPSRIQLAAAILATSIVSGMATVRYVDASNPNPATPYTTWATAARVIQDAVDAAVAGDEIIVTNGTYTTGGRAVAVCGLTVNRVALDKPVAVRSVNGPEVTIIQGRQVAGTTNGVGAVRCAYLATGANLSGFTLTGGATETRDKEGSDELASGGGVWCETAVVTNCIIVGNAADISGGGCFRGTITDCAFSNNTVGSAYGTGGGAAFASLISCLITSNSAFEGGGAYSGVLTNCTLIGNAAVAGGGGSYATLINCFMMSNSATSYGGGNYGGALTNCTLIGNAAKRGGGAASSDLSNCLVISNTAAHDETYGYGFGGGALSGRLYNCTLVGNEGSGAYGEWGGHICCTCILYNCILSHNSCDDSVQWADLSASALAYNCYFAGDLGLVAVEWMDWGGTIPWFWSVAGDPRFVDEAAGDLRLRSDSPCINAGRNDYALAGTDFDGNPRIVGSAVDIGAFEFQSPQSTLPYWWLQQYALPTDGSADFADTDSDGHNNWQEWRADTVPTNALSRLALLGVTNAPGRVGVTWQSVATRSYFVERATNLSGAHPFMSVQTGIPGQAGTTSFTDTNVSSGGPFFYRVGVQ